MRFAEWIINEEIYPNNTATVFHRTKWAGSIQGTIKNGFKAGSGAHYGVGFYATFDLNTQLSQNMIGTYGEYILKYKAEKLNEYLVFNYNEAKSIHGAEWKLSDQLEKFGIKKLFDIQTLQNIDNSMGEKYTADAAFRVVQIGNIQSYVKGIIFTGQNDGNVFLKYEPVDDGSLTLISYAHVPTPDTPINWETQTNKAKIKSIYSMPNSEKRVSMGSIYKNQDLTGSLIAASSKGDVTGVYKLIKSGADGFDSALESARENNQINAYKILLNYATQESKNNQLRVTSGLGQIDLMKMAIQKGANDFNYAVQNSTRTGKWNVFEFLISNYQINPSVVKQSLGVAFQQKKFDMVNLILQHQQIDPNDILEIAAQNQNKEFIDYALSKGAKNIDRALYYLSSINNDELYNYVLSKQQMLNSAVTPKNSWLSKFRSYYRK